MKPFPISDEVKAMVAMRHSAEQRGNYEPFGRVQWLRTVHGLIYFPADSQTGEGCGPDLGYVSPDSSIAAQIENGGAMIMLGAWEGLPSLRFNTSKPCPKCRHLCDVCKGERKKLCELCGGRTWIPGPWLPCPGPGCVRDGGGFATGKINPAGCATCGSTGQVPEQVLCEMCEATGKQVCTRCKGTGKYSTGRVNGAIDWDVSPKCKACDGTTYQGKWVRQDISKFTNAILVQAGILNPRDVTHLGAGPLKNRRSFAENPRTFTVLGPITQFAIRDPRSLRTRMFDVGADAAGDHLVLLVPRSPRQRPQKAYLVGGVVREREMRNGAA
jgi:hypothetical protein